jgi:hypothetical protein
MVHVASDRFIGVLFSSALLASGAANRACAEPQSTCPVARTQALTTVVRIAESKDGLTFADREKAFLQGASAPSLVRLPNGRLLALFDYALGASGDATVMAVSRSADDGRSWSRPQAICLEGAGTRGSQCGHGALTMMPNGVLRLYFIALTSGNDAKRERAAESIPAGQTTGINPVAHESCAILSAVTRNGLEYKLDRDVKVPLDGGWDVHPTVVRVDRRVDLYVDALDAARAVRKSRAGIVLRLTSSDGRRFRPGAAVRTSGVYFVGCVSAIGNRFRAYVTGAEGICSMVSDDGAVWTVEEGLRLAGGSDPAVVQLKDGTFLMFYGTEADARSRGLPQLGLTSSVRESPLAGDGALSGGEAAAAGGSTGEKADGTGGTASGAGSGSGTAGGWESFAPESAETALALTEGAGGIDGFAQPTDSSGVGGSAGTGNESDRGRGAAGDPFPPKPDFIHPVDYLAWLQQLFPPDVDDNAYDAFVKLAPQSVPGGDSERPAWWPGTINDMFNGNYNGPIVPWAPGDHPEWEATHQMMGVGLDQFREVARFPNYACPYLVSPNSPGGPDGHHLMAELLLPSLAANRSLVRATLADAWRAENGRVSPERMTDAFETCLRNADQMEQGFTLIHRLVGIAEQALTEENARAALANNVYQTPEQIESALNVLRQYDQPSGDPAGWLALEHASNMDVLQYCFSPAGPDGQPQLNRDRARYAMGMYHGDNQAATEEELSRAAQIPPEDVRTAVDTLDAHYRELAEKWRIGYPQVRADDIGRFEERNANTNEITKTLLPSLSRAYEIMTRNEASRRGTQLTYAVHLFKARNGRWPASLDELPPGYGETMKTDPFTGGRFGYRMSESGPTIYSLSNNGRDDGGVHSAKWGDDREGGGDSDDYVFWPYQPRK